MELAKEYADMTNDIYYSDIKVGDIVIAIRNVSDTAYPIETGEKYRVVERYHCGSPSDPKLRASDSCKVCPKDCLAVHVRDIHNMNPVVTCGWILTNEKGKEYKIGYR